MTESEKYLTEEYINSDRFTELSREYLRRGIEVQLTVHPSGNIYNTIRDRFGEYAANRMLIQLGTSMIWSSDVIDSEWVRSMNTELLISAIQAAEVYLDYRRNTIEVVESVNEFFDYMTTNIGREFLGEAVSDDVSRDIGALLIFDHRESVDYVRDNLPQSTELLHHLYEYSNTVDYGRLDDVIDYDDYFYLARSAYENDTSYEFIQSSRDESSRLTRSKNHSQSTIVPLTLVRLSNV